MSAREDLHVITDTDRRGAQTFAVDLNGALYADTRRLVALTAGVQRNPLSIPVLGPGRLHPRSLGGLRGRMSGASVSIAHGSSTLVASAVAGIGLTTPFVYRQISDQQAWAGTRLRRLRVSAYLRRAEHVVALHEGAANTLVADFGVERRRVTVIPNGVPPQRFGPVDEAGRQRAREHFEVPSDVPLLLSLGALVPEKGVDRAVAATARLSGAHLLVVGDGPQLDALQAQARSVAPGRVHFHAPVTDPAQAYAAADVLVLASRSGDSMPAVLIEAGMRGLPAVSTDVGAIPEIVLDGRTGRIVVDAGTAALVAAVDDALSDRVALGAAARTHCLAHYAIDVVARQWDAVLDTVHHHRS